jgi:hypothetical protein
MDFISSSLNACGDWDGVWDGDDEEEEEDGKREFHCSWSRNDSTTPGLDRIA